jgi:hypothetical protein
LRTEPALANVVNLTTAPLGGRLHWMATFDDGSVRRLDASGHVSPPSQTELAEAAQRIAGDTGIAEQRLVRTPRTLTESRCPVLRRSDSGLWIPVGDEAA